MIFRSSLSWSTNVGKPITCGKMKHITFICMVEAKTSEFQNNIIPNGSPHLSTVRTP